MGSAASPVLIRHFPGSIVSGSIFEVMTADSMTRAALLRRPGCSHVPMLARHRRVKGVTSTRLPDIRPLRHPVARGRVKCVTAMSEV
jgi:hypothetical protein